MLRPMRGADDGQEAAFRRGYSQAAARDRGATACRSAGISDATYYTGRKKFGGMGRSQLSEFKTLEKENQRLKKIVANLELDKLILKKSLDVLKPEG